MLSTPLSCCSIGVATDCSTVSADAPWYVVSTRTLGGASAGYCSIGSPDSALSPTRTVRIAMTIATMGRRMKKWPMRSVFPAVRWRFGSRVRGRFRLRRRGRLRRRTGLFDGHDRRLDRDAVADFLQPFDDDLLAGREPAFDYPQRIDAFAGLDRTHRDLAVVGYDGHGVRGLQLLDGALRNQNCALAEIDRSAHPSVLARTDELLRIRETDFEHQRAGGGIDQTVGKLETAAMIVHRPVAENELEATGIFFGLVSRRARVLEIVAFGDREAHVDRIDRRDRRKQRVVAAADQVARLDLGLSDETVDRGIDFRVLEVDGGVVDRSAFRVDDCAGGALQGNGRIVLLARNRVQRDERLVTGHVLARARKVGPRAGQPSSRLGERRLKIARVDRVEEVTFLDEAAFLEIDRLEKARRPRPDLDLLRTERLADALDVNGNVALENGCDLDVGRRRRDRCRFRAGRRGQADGEPGRGIACPRPAEEVFHRSFSPCPHGPQSKFGSTPHSATSHASKGNAEAKSQRRPTAAARTARWPRDFHRHDLQAVRRSDRVGRTLGSVRVTRNEGTGIWLAGQKFAGLRQDVDSLRLDLEPAVDPVERNQEPAAVKAEQADLFARRNLFALAEQHGRHDRDARRPQIGALDERTVTEVALRRTELLPFAIGDLEQVGLFRINGKACRPIGR